jgi:hypothetical protein
MNVALIEMPLVASNEQLQMYRDFCAEHPDDAEAGEILVGLEELAEGTPLLQLRTVFFDVPVDHRGRPKLAIARADRLRVRVNGWGSRPGGLFTFECDYEWRRGRKAKNAEVRVESPLAHGGVPAGYAIVPIVPPNLRRGRELMAKLHILWEVERWADHPREVGPDVDPYLLRRVSTDLWAVIGQWELSPIERAILAGRRR